MTMRDKIARVLAYRAYGHEEPADKYFRDYLGTADAVLDAMREPTREMCLASVPVVFAKGSKTEAALIEEATEVWARMIASAKEQR
jgi:hypothetical protein